MVKVPPTMRSLVAPKPCSPSGYEVLEMPTPNITHPKHVLLRVKAASISTGDTQFAKGMLKKFLPMEFPHKVGREGSGIIVAIGSAVKDVKVGDAVYGFNMDKPISDEPASGFVSEYIVSRERFIVPKPPTLSFEDAATLIARTVTAYQVIRRGLQLRGEESLEGKTVYVPGALSASGSVFIEMAKNVFGAKTIISTVSTPKMKLVEEHLPGLVDQLIDYQTQNILDVVPKGSVDYMYNTQWNTMNDGIKLLKPHTGTLMSITGIPTKSTMIGMLADNLPVWVGWLLDLAQLWYLWKLAGTGLKYEMVSGSPNIREDMEKSAELIAQGKIHAVTTVVDLKDEDETIITTIISRFIYNAYPQQLSGFTTPPPRTMVLLKRKRSVSELTTSPSSSVSSFDSPPRGSTRTIDCTPIHLHSRTLKRFRNSRPSDHEVHRKFYHAPTITRVLTHSVSLERTLNILYSAQQDHAPALSTFEHRQHMAQAAEVASTATQQQSLHRFWNINSTPASMESSPNLEQQSSTPTNCDDCGTNFGGGGDSSIEVDSYGSEDHACGACGKNVCFSCSVSKLGEQRRCLQCAGGNV
ncbi:hypothetical protein G7046_g2391 [Stylonectria norvegica]|nr:hypothetical protein G7046_g2391 [Stylonectria norvegica]